MEYSEEVHKVMWPGRLHSNHCICIHLQGWIWVLIATVYGVPPFILLSHYGHQTFSFTTVLKSKQLPLAKLCYWQLQTLKSKGGLCTQPWFTIIETGWRSLQRNMPMHIQPPLGKEIPGHTHDSTINTTPEPTVSMYRSALVLATC